MFIANELIMVDIACERLENISVRSVYVISGHCLVIESSLMLLGGQQPDR